MSEGPKESEASAPPEAVARGDATPRADTNEADALTRSTADGAKPKKPRLRQLPALIASIEITRQF